MQPRAEPKSLDDYERGFRRAGLPLFIEDYSAYEDIFTRAFPLLALVFVTQVMGAADLDWSVWANLAAVAGGLAILAGGVVLLNRQRGRRMLSVPERVGVPELAAFVLVPALLPLVFGGQVVSALVTAGGNLALLVVVYLVVGLGVLSIVRWAARRLVGQLTASLELLSRAVPLLLVFALVLFINTEMWQVFSGVPDVFLALIAALFVATGSTFLVVRLPRDVAVLEREVSPGAPLRPRERFNVGLVMFVSQGLQVLVVSVAVGAFFVLFGALAIGPGVLDAWIGGQGDEVLAVRLFGEEARVTVELLEVSGGLAAFSGVYYAIAVLTDSVYRGEFLSELEDTMRDTFRARADYLAARSSAGSARTSSAPSGDTS
jgi:hypothetical protein